MEEIVNLFHGFAVALQPCNIMGMRRGIVLGVSIGAIPHVAPELIAREPKWQAMVQHMGSAFAQRRFEEGLTQALAEVSVPLVAHFPAQAQANPNDLPDTPVLG